MNAKASTYALRIPGEPEDLWNYRICGASTQIKGKPCKSRAQSDLEGFCSQHAPSVVKAKQQAKQQAERIAEEKYQKIALERDKHVWKTAGDPLRTGLDQQLRSAGVSSIISSRFTIICVRTARFATGAYDKRDMMKGIPDDGRFIVIWSGEWRSDAFICTADEIRDFLK